MNNRDLVRLRLRNQRLSGGALETPVDVVRWLGAVQSQELAVAKWSLARRARRGTNAEIDDAIASGAILRTHVLRPTWHFVAPEDIRWMVTLTAPRVRAAMAPYDRKLGLTDAVYDAGHAAIAGALAGGKALTRTELQAALGSAGLEATGQRLGHFLMRAELDLMVCSGPPKGKQQTYALLDERVTRGKKLTRDQALAELSQRYFTGHGPAGLKDFMWWSGLTAADAKRGIALIGDRLQRLVVDDRTFLVVDTSRPRTGASPAALLLQGYDEYIIGYGDTRWLLSPGKPAGVLPRGQVMFTHAIVVDGQVVGHWRRSPGAKNADVEAFFTRRLAAAEKRALDEELVRYGRFMGLPASLRVTSAR
jgi:hypothetical protein